MYCPVCRCEYLEGVTHCVDCQVPLVDKIPEDPKELPYELKDLIILRHYPHRHEAEIVAGLLQANGIDAITSLEDWGRIHPALSNASHPGAVPLASPIQQGVRLMIRENDRERAETLLNETSKNTLDPDTTETEVPNPTPSNQPEKKLSKGFLLIFFMIIILIVLWVFIKR